AHQPNRRLRLAAEPQTGRREVSALTDARKTLAYDFFRILRAPLLRPLATYLASWTRDYETVYRYGGEEFIIIVKAANDEEACRAGVRICQLVDNHAITHSEGHINITVTAGVSRAFPEEPLDVVIGRADRAMYEGKQTGRNRCMFIDEQNVINRV
ncbi:diguanylate cyclase, partial [Escherichia coli]|nr:diguanylate cyclase [Escherichia coli]